MDCLLYLVLFSLGSLFEADSATHGYPHLEKVTLAKNFEGV